MKNKYFQMPKAIIILIFSFLFIFICLFFFPKIKKTEQQNKETLLVHKSEFFKMMYEENDYDFIKTGEKELENIESYIECYKENFPFYFFIKIQRDCLFVELNNKIYHLLLNNQIISEDTDYDSYVEQHRESLLSLKEKGRILEYKEIDYIELFRRYCIEWNSYDDYLNFCEKFSIEPVKEITELDKQISASYFQNYFPKGTFDKVQNEILSSFLDYFDPDSIMHMEKGHDELRFYCIEARKYSYLIKICWTKFSRYMEVIVEDSPARHKKINISKAELIKLLDLFSECDFYNQKSNYDIILNDGTNYVCEVNIDGKYKVVSRWGPDYEPFIFEIHDFLVKKTGGVPNQGKRAWNLLQN